MRYHMSLVLALRKDGDNHDEVEQEQVEDSEPAKEVIIVISCSKHAGQKLRLVNVVGQFKISPMSDRGQDSSHRILMHSNHKVDIGVEDRRLGLRQQSPGATEHLHIPKTRTSR